MSEPPAESDAGKPGEPVAGPVRAYDLAFDRRYQVPPPPPPVPPLPGEPGYVPDLVPAAWDGLNLNVDEDRDGQGWFTGIVTKVTGWYAGPPVDGNNAERALADGSIWGPKLLRSREITIEGAAIGPRGRLMRLRDELACRAALRGPSELIIGDRQLGTSLSAMVRADTGSFQHEFFAGPRAFRWQVTVTAADPRLYDREWRQVVLTTRTPADAGRPYDRLYWHPRTADPVPDPLNGWAYGEPYPPDSAAYMRNDGNADAPVYATYDGDLDQHSRLTDDERSILLAEVLAGVQILVATEPMTAEAPGGAGRAQWILPGSRPMTIPPFSTARWRLYGQGSGTVTLSWRSAWT